MSDLPEPIRCVCAPYPGATKTPNPACRVCVDPADWPDPPGFTATGAGFTSHASPMSNRAESTTCLRCGARVPSDMDRHGTSSGRHRASGPALHALWHLKQDWLARVGPKAPLYAAAGYSLAEAAAAELDAPQPVEELRSMAVLRALS